MIRNVLALLATFVVLLAAAAAAAIPTSTFASLNPTPAAGELAWITDGNGTPTAGVAAAGGGINRDLVSYDPVDARWEFMQRVPVSAPPAELEKYLDAARVRFNNDVYGGAFDSVQEAVDQVLLAGGAGTDLAATPTANDVGIGSSTGGGANIPGVTVTTAGVLSASDYAELLEVLGGPTIVRSWAEVEAATRAADESDVGPYAPDDRVLSWIRFSDDFTGDWDSTSPHRINLPTGGTDHGRVVIDFGNVEVSALDLASLEINAGRTDGAGADLPGCDIGDGTIAYLAHEPGCMGFAHDSELQIVGGFFPARDPSCDATPTANCGRTAIKFLNFDRIYAGPGAGLGTRLVLGPRIKCGGGLGSDPGESVFPSFSLPGDACFEITPSWTSISVLGPAQFEAVTAIRGVDSTVGGWATNAIRWVVGEGVYFQQKGSTTAGACVRCDSGFFDLEFSTAGSHFYFAGPHFESRPGNIRGGKLNGSLFAQWPGAAASQCWDTTASDKSFIDSGLNASDRLSGSLTIVGDVCSPHGLRSARVGALVLNWVLENTVPGFLATDTALGATPRPTPFVTDAAGDVEALEMRFVTAARVTDYDPADLLDDATKTGGALSGAPGNYVYIDLGPSGWVYTEHGAATLRKSTSNQIADRVAPIPFTVLTGGGTFAAPNDPIIGQCLQVDSGLPTQGCALTSTSQMLIDNSAGDLYLSGLSCLQSNFTDWESSGSSISIQANFAGAAGGVGTNFGPAVAITDVAGATLVNDFSALTPIPVAEPGRFRLRVSAYTDGGGGAVFTCSATIVRVPN